VTKAIEVVKAAATNQKPIACDARKPPPVAFPVGPRQRDRWPVRAVVLI
jgi:hypothetical protein